MNAIPTYVIWDTCTGYYYGGNYRCTATTNKENSVNLCAKLKPVYQHSYMVIEDWGDGIEYIIYKNDYNAMS